MTIYIDLQLSRPISDTHNVHFWDGRRLISLVANLLNCQMNAINKDFYMKIHYMYKYEIFIFLLFLVLWLGCDQILIGILMSTREQPLRKMWFSHEISLWSISKWASVWRVLTPTNAPIDSKYSVPDFGIGSLTFCAHTRVRSSTCRVLIYLSQP